MPEFTYKAIDSQGKLTRGSRDANSIAELEQSLQRSGLDLLTAREVRKGALGKLGRLLTLGRVRRTELIEFSNNMRVMLGAGVPLVDAMMELRSEQSNRYFARVIEKLIEDVQSGDSLNKAMEKWPKCFPPLYANIIEIGENTGRLDTVFAELVNHYKRLDDLQKNARKALIYPFFVLLTLIFVAIVFLGKVFPVIFKMFEEFEIRELPAITEFFLAMSQFVQRSWYLLIAAIVLFILLIVVLRRIRVTRRGFDWLEINLPFVRSFFLQLRMAFFSRYLATLQKAGVDILRSLELAARAINNLVLEDIMDRSRKDVEQGMQLSDALKSNGRMIPNMVIRMISVGEAAGTLPEQLDFVASYYDEGLERRIAILLALMEPLLIILLAAVGLALVMAILLPMYEFLGQIFSNY